MIFALIGLIWLLAVLVLLGACRAAAAGDRLPAIPEHALARAPRPQVPEHAPARALRLPLRARHARPRSRALQASSR
ncbi:MAG TPA: hypothetical protein VGN13_05800 [Solirubrobacteraceae bacterium]|jgi:hypothetical protein